MIVVYRTTQYWVTK